MAKRGFIGIIPRVLGSYIIEAFISYWETKPHQQVANRKEHVSHLVLWRITTRVTALGNRTMFLQGRIGFSICIVHNDLALDAGIPAQAIVSQ